jgi:catalase
MLPGVITHEEAMERIHARFGVHPGHRAFHAKGVIYAGTFTATPRAVELTRAGHMAGAPVPATVRFSNGGGDPTVPDYFPDVRGLAVSFHLPDGSRTDILGQTIPHFPFPDQEGFFAALEVSKRDLRALLKLPWFAIRYPKAVKQLPEVNRLMAQQSSFAARTFYAFHAYKWVDANGGGRFVRYRWLPTVDEPPISKDEAKERGRDWLFDEMAQRLAREPVRMELEVQIAAGNDNPDDPSDEWPAERERVIVGTLEVTGVDGDADDGIVFDPMRLVDGIEPSGDPVLHYRPAVYSLSHAERTK